MLHRHMLAAVHAAAELGVGCSPVGDEGCWSLGSLFPVVLQSRLRGGCRPLTASQPQQHHQRQQRPAHEIHGAAAAAAPATAAPSSTAAGACRRRGQLRLLQSTQRPPGWAAPPASTPLAHQTSSGRSRRPSSRGPVQLLQGRAPQQCFRRRCSGRLQAPSGPQRQAGGARQKAFPLCNKCCCKTQR